MCRNLAIFIAFVILTGCSSAQFVKTGEPFVIPPIPKVVSVDRGKVDIKKYPDTYWVKKPTKIMPNQVYRTEGGTEWAWKNDDMDAISQGLVEWPKWGFKVKKLIDDYNQGLKKSWWKFW